MKKISLFSVLFWGLSTLVALAQITDIDVSVRQLTRQQAISGITVYLENPAIGVSRQAVTNANGQVTFGSVSLNGTYRVFTKEDATYLESAAENIVLRANSRQSVTL